MFESESAWIHIGFGRLDPDPPDPGGKKTHNTERNEEVSCLLCGIWKEVENFEYCFPGCRKLCLEFGLVDYSAIHVIHRILIFDPSFLSYMSLTLCYLSKMNGCGFSALVRAGEPSDE
jgi:hypothetical protein